MTQAAPAIYMPAPLPNVRYNEQDQSHKWMIYSVALGCLSYYAPKTFYIGSVGLFFGSMVFFNQRVHRADTTQLQHVHSLAHNLCQLIYSVGVVMTVRGFHSWGLSVQALRHSHVLSAARHFATGFFLWVFGLGGTYPFKQRADELSSRRHWIEMEDYITNFPPEIKKTLSFSSIVFFMIAVFPDKGIGFWISNMSFLFSQFNELYKSDRLLKYLKTSVRIPNIADHNNWTHWVLAVHYLQGFASDPQAQALFDPHLKRIAKASTDDQIAQLPSPLKEQFAAFKTPESQPPDTSPG